LAARVFGNSLARDVQFLCFSNAFVCSVKDLAAPFYMALLSSVMQILRKSSYLITTGSYWK